MLGRRIALLRQVLLFVLVTLLGIVTGYLTSERHPPVVLRALERSALPLAIVIAVVIVAVMIWHQVADERGGPAPVWDSARPPFPGLEAFTEQDAGVFSAGLRRLPSCWIGLILLSPPRLIGLSQ